MTSGKQARRQRQVQARPPVRSTGGRRASPKILLAAAAGIAGLVAAVVLVVVFGGGSSSPSTTAAASTLPDSNVITRLFKGIPQHGMVLGKPSAPLTMVEYVDLQCPGCRAFETEVLPTILDRYVRTGKVKIEARPVAFIGPDSIRGRNAAIAAADQNRFFNFAELLYFNQGGENSGWLSDDMIAAAANSIPGVDVATLASRSRSSSVAARAKEFDSQADADHLSGTPGIYVGKTGGKLTVVSPQTAPDVPVLSAALDKALQAQ